MNTSLERKGNILNRKFSRWNIFVQVTPQDEGQQRISLYDQCLDASDPARAIVTLSDVYALRLTVGDKVRYQQANTNFSVIVILIDITKLKIFTKKKLQIKKKK